MQFQIGQVYERPCAVIRMDDGRAYRIPVIDHLHADPQFGFPHQHYHIDARFYMEPRMAHQYALNDGETASVIVPDAITPQFEGIEKRNVKCVRQFTGLAIPEKPTERQVQKLALYDEWYDSFVGRKCEGKRCPHYGTEMVERDGQLICPLHKLTADPISLLVIPRK